MKSERESCSIYISVPDLNFYHFEIFLAGAAFWTSPVDGDILPAGTRGDAILWPAFGFVVDKAADHAHVAIVGSFALSGHG